MLCCACIRRYSGELLDSYGRDERRNNKDNTRATPNKKHSIRSVKSRNKYKFNKVSYFVLTLCLVKSNCIFKKYSDSLKITTDDEWLKAFVPTKDIITEEISQTNECSRSCI
jgi:hypothetical protein